MQAFGSVYVLAFQPFAETFSNDKIHNQSNMGSYGSGINGGIPFPAAFGMEEYSEEFETILAMEIKDENLAEVVAVIRKQRGMWEEF